MAITRGACDPVWNVVPYLGLRNQDRCRLKVAHEAVRTFEQVSPAVGAKKYPQTLVCVVTTLAVTARLPVKKF